MMSMAQLHFATNRVTDLQPLSLPKLHLTKRVVLVIVDGLGLEVALSPLDAEGKDDGGNPNPTPIPTLFQCMPHQILTEEPKSPTHLSPHYFNTT